MRTQRQSQSPASARHHRETNRRAMFIRRANEPVAIRSLRLRDQRHRQSVLDSLNGSRVSRIREQGIAAATAMLVAEQNNDLAGVHEHAAATEIAAQSLNGIVQKHARHNARRQPARSSRIQSCVNVFIP